MMWTSNAITARVRELLATSHDGLGYAALRTQMPGCNDRTVERAMCRMVDARLVVRTGGVKGKPAVFFDPKHAPTNTGVIAANPIRDSRKTLDPKQKAVVPRGVKVTKGPNFDPERRWKATSAPRIVNAADARPWAMSIGAQA